MSPMTLSANSMEKMQVFCPWSSLRMSACTVPRTCASVRESNLLVYVRRHQLLAIHTEQGQPRAIVSGRQFALIVWRRAAGRYAQRLDTRLRLRPVALGTQMALHVLVNGGVQEHRQNIGAGPLMVIETDVLGELRSKPEYSFFMSSSEAIETPELPVRP